mmetsp:Transcript_13564/g.20021  ORF Transcript_13564/g.20021 Transcript_13564/m.20021 type:complete len:172 (+) Transcript_13564:152-667(+)
MHSRLSDKGTYTARSRLAGIWFFLALLLLNLTAVTLTVDAQASFDKENCSEFYEDLVLCHYEDLACTLCEDVTQLDHDAGDCSDLPILCQYTECCPNCAVEVQNNMICHHSACGNTNCDAIGDVAILDTETEPARTPDSVYDAPIAGKKASKKGSKKSPKSKGKKQDNNRQ